MGALLGGGMGDLLGGLMGGGLPEGLDPALLLKAGKALSSMKDQPDDRCTLLTALKPYLRRERRERVDEAVRMLKLLRVAELFRKDLF